MEYRASIFNVKGLDDYIETVASDFAEDPVELHYVDVSAEDEVIAKARAKRHLMRWWKDYVKTVKDEGRWIHKDDYYIKVEPIGWGTDTSRTYKKLR